MQDWKTCFPGDQPKEHRKVWELCLILQALFLRDFALGGIDDSECDFSSSKSLIKEWICGTNLGCSHCWGWEAWAGRESSSKGGQECSEKRPQMWKLSPAGETFPADFTWSFVINFPAAQREGEPKPGTEQHNPTHGFTAGLINHAKLCRKSPALHRTPTRLQLELSLFYSWINSCERQKRSEPSLCPLLGVHCFPNEWKCPLWCLSPVKWHLLTRRQWKGSEFIPISATKYCNITGCEEICHFN